jgi:ketosteroid isomerase-like protein
MEAVSYILSPSDRARAIFKAFDSEQVELLAGFMADDVRFRLENAPVAVGKPAFVHAFNRFLDSVMGFWHDVVDVWVDGEMLVAELEVHYTRLDGREVTVPGCGIFRLRHGLVADYRSYIDTTPVYS